MEQALPPSCMQSSTWIFRCTDAGLNRIDTPNYLLYLKNRFIAAGGISVRAKLSSLAELTRDPKPAAIINCSGIGAFELVKDAKVYPTRGQTVLVRAPWILKSDGGSGGITRTGAEGIYTYIIPRKSGDVIIGGTAEVDDWYVHHACSTIHSPCLTDAL